MNQEIRECYKILEIEDGASLEEIRSAYKNLSIIWHPDRMPQDNSELINKANNKLKEINYAYATLKSREAKHKKQNSTNEDTNISNNSNNNASNANDNKANQYQFEAKYVLEKAHEFFPDMLVFCEKIIIMFLSLLFFVEISLILPLLSDLEYGSAIFLIAVFIICDCYVLYLYLFILNLGRSEKFRLITNSLKKLVDTNEYAIKINKQGLICNSHVENSQNGQLILWKNIMKVYYFNLWQYSLIAIYSNDSQFLIPLLLTLKGKNVLSASKSSILKAISYYSENKFSF